MSEDTIRETIARLTEGTDWVVRDAATWIYVAPPGEPRPPHGWKLHLSCRAARFVHVVRQVVPLLLAERCHFKLARSEETLRTLNDGRQSPAAVGKAFTIYPPESRVRELGQRLATLLMGEPGPRVLSDRQVAEGAPVYYRYGPFGKTLRAELTGRLVTVITGPDGEEFEGTANLLYRQPSWTVDPFTGETAATANACRTKVLGEHYRLTEGIMESARGSVYRATDARTGETVIVKQARALVAEHVEGVDARLRLRNERRVLVQLAEVPGVPRFLDHFAHGADEFLVITDQGARNLGDDVARNGRYLPIGAAASEVRSLDRLARELAAILQQIHARGVLVRDLSPKNVVVAESGALSLIDFGLASSGDVLLPGGTEGYSPPGQLSGAPTRRYDDLYALGMTLMFAATSASPSASSADPELPRQRALQVLRLIYGSQPPPSVAAIMDLLSLDPERAERALDLLARGEPAFDGGAAVPELPIIDRAVLDEWIDDSISELLAGVEAILDPAAGGESFNYFNLYSGTAGMGLELLHHRDRAEVRAVLPRLAAWTRHTALRTRPKPGLYVGSTGVELFLRGMASHGIAVDRLPPNMVIPDADWVPTGDDLMVGAAGVGLGHLRMHRSDPRPEHLEIIERCARSSLRELVPASLFPAEDIPVTAGLDTSTGLAHGQAGVLEFLLDLAESGIREIRGAELSIRVDSLAARTRTLIGLSANAAAVPLCVSWCRGLAGIAGTLLHAARVTGDRSLSDLAAEAGHVCVSWIPYLSTVGQCCGLAGVGNVLVDLAREREDERFAIAARAVVAQILIGGRFDPPRKKKRDHGSLRDKLSWATGAAGLLGFLRRLRDGDGEGASSIFIS